MYLWKVTVRLFEEGYDVEKSKMKVFSEDDKHYNLKLLTIPKKDLKKPRPIGDNVLPGTSIKYYTFCLTEGKSSAVKLLKKEIETRLDFLHENLNKLNQGSRVVRRMGKEVSRNKKCKVEDINCGNCLYKDMMVGVAIQTCKSCMMFSNWESNK